MNKGLKIFGGLMVGMLLAAVFVGTALAQGPAGDGGSVPNLDGTGRRQGHGDGFGRFGDSRGYGFVDEDGDGVNDRAPADHEFVDEDGDGICDLEPDQIQQGMGRGYRQSNESVYGRGYGFVDEDGDGVNDRAPADHEFVDEDGDGLCDEHGAAPRQGRGLGRNQNAN